MKGSPSRVLYYFLRIGFGLLLIAASFGKLRQPLEFAQAVENYLVFGETLSRWAAVWIPWLELATGLCLLFGVWPDAAVAVNGLLMGAFLVLILQAFFRHLDIYCGCFRSKGESTIDWLKVLENFGYAAGAAVLAFLYRRLHSKTG